MARKKSYILEEYKATKELHNEFCNKIQGLLSDILKQNNLNYHSIDSRVKEESSLAAKVKNGNGKYKTLSDITDVSGLRIITYFSEDVDKIASIIQSEFDIDEKNSVDKRIKLDPDRFGYLSVHYVVRMSESRIRLPEYSRFKDIKVEIQIRSILQHAWAEIEHDLGYKSKQAIPRLVRRDFSRLAGLLELVDEEFVKIRKNLKHYNESIKEEIKVKPSNVLIDKVTMGQLLIERDSIVKKLDERISFIANAALKLPDDIELDKDVQRLKYLGFNTINDLIIALNKYQDVIIRYAKEWLVDNEDPYIFSGLSLFYLCYAVLAERNSHEDIIEYLRYFHIGDAEENDDFADEILHLYK